MHPGVNSLIELRRFLKPQLLPAWHQHIVQRELNGGRTSDRDLDRIGPDVTTLTVSGLDQSTFENLASRFGSQLSALHLWKCPRLVDLSPMEGLSKLTHAAIFWNQRAAQLWNMRQTPKLQSLHFTDFIKLDRLDDLARAADSLVELEFGNANFSRYIVQTLEPLGTLTNLNRLSFNAQSIVDGRIQPLAELRQLSELDLPSGQFSVEQLAWLRTKLPLSVASPALNPFRQLRQPLRRGAKELDLLVNGKGMPFLSSSSDTKRTEKYTNAFHALVARFEANPEEEPSAGEA